MPRALLSVSDKTGVADLGRGLVERGFELISTGGTARTLADAGLPVTNVSDVTGFPEMMDGRVKTLHPALHGGILARRDRPDDIEAIAALGISLVDVVVVNLYPFVKAAANPATPFDALVEEIDIGGPSMVRAAAKNFRGVMVVVDPVDYGRLLSEIDLGPSLAFRFDLMRKALAHTASYDTAISRTLAAVDLNGEQFARRSSSLVVLPVSFDLGLEKVRDLRYGENSHQKAAWYVASGGQGAGGGFGAAKILQGRELSYTNLLDLDAAARIALEFDEPAAVVVKHTNPCGAAIGITAADAYVRAREADSLAAFGGIVAVNRVIDVLTAEAIVSTFIEAVIAPAVDPEALPVLARRANMRVVVADFSQLKSGGVDFRTILGATLAQERDFVAEAQRPWTGQLPDGFKIASKREPTIEEWEALRFAWRVCAHVKSNTVIFTSARQTLAVGAGQMSRVDAVNVAVMKAREVAKNPSRPLAGSVAASDAFFPFRDGLDAVVAAGATAVVQPGGSVRDAEVIAAADEFGIAMVFTGRRHFRH
ncbi:MAG: bifunctional phosphoribosylaminoimidazolecarboxamide formyltransferase/IMP cyclohydrolase [Vicinamibacterales bacterium]